MNTPKPAKTPRLPAPRLSPQTAEAASIFLHHRGASRPVSTLAWAAAAGLAACPSEPSAMPGILNLKMDQDDFLDALFNDWHMAPEAWTKAETKGGLALLQLVVREQRAVLPALPAYPARPTLSGPVLDKLWHHLDLAAWRSARFMNDPGLEPLVDREAQVWRLVQEGVDLLEQFLRMMLKAYTDHGASARDYTEELAGLLRRIHRTLDQAALSAGTDPLGWPVPDYTAFAGEPYPLPNGPRGSLLPDTLAQDLQRALDGRQCPRPLSTVLPMVQLYCALKQALDPGWSWSPARDGRECAFILFESSLVDLPPWTPSQARELSRLCTAIQAWGAGQPLPLLPPMDLDPEDAEAALLWQHQDLLFLAGSILGVELGILGELDEPGTTKRQRRLREKWGETQSLLWGALAHWESANSEDRALLVQALPLALSAVYQALRNEIAEVDRVFLRFIPKPPETLLPRPKAPMVRFGRIRKR